MKVSDWSQPIKIAIFLGFFVAAVAFVCFVVIPFGVEVLDLLRQIAEGSS